jgi:hypothetical protein
MGCKSEEIEEDEGQRTQAGESDELLEVLLEI